MKTIPSKQDSTVKSMEESTSDVQTADLFGPSLPPNYYKKENSGEKTYGPTLPDILSRKDGVHLSGSTASTSGRKNKILIGPVLPEYMKPTIGIELEEPETPASSDNDQFGPSTTLMASGDVSGYYKHSNAQIQNIKSVSETVVEREAWMTELPEKKRANLGFLPRHFKSRIQSDKESDSSVWTDTPADKKRKEKDNKKDLKEILKRKRLQERDKEMEKLAKKAAKKLRKKESLLEIHQRNMKAKQKKSSKEGEALPERRPFDRNIDLQIRKFDEGQKRAILNKSLFLNDRFAPGESKFL